MRDRGQLANSLLPCLPHPPRYARKEHLITVLETFRKEDKTGKNPQGCNQRLVFRQKEKKRKVRKKRKIFLL